VTTDPPQRVPRLHRNPAHLLRHALLIVVFNGVYWALHMLNNPGDRWDIPMVYSQAIGLSIWVIIDLGRLRLNPDPRTGWLAGPKAVALVCTGVVVGYVVGTLIGDLYCGCSTWHSWRDSPRRILAAAAGAVFASAVVTGFFTSRGRIMAQRELLAEAERDATLARLALLQSQLEPHMLFNTLANLRVLIGLDPARAQAMLDRLIAFLRATLSASRSEAHSVAAEFDRLRDYLELMAVRMGPRLQAGFDLPADVAGLSMPPLLLQPLVENGIQHGLEPQVQGGRIDVAARREGDTLVLTVRDTGVGLEGAPPSNGTRFGLKQVRERLKTLYADRAGLTLEPAADGAGGTLATLRLPVATAAALPQAPATGLPTAPSRPEAAA
jgi:hypothetical protein